MILCSLALSETSYGFCASDTLFSFWIGVDSNPMTSKLYFEKYCNLIFVTSPINGLTFSNKQTSSSTEVEAASGTVKVKMFAILLSGPGSLDHLHSLADVITWGSPVRWVKCLKSSLRQGQGVVMCRLWEGRREKLTICVPKVGLCKFATGILDHKDFKIVSLLSYQRN